MSENKKYKIEHDRDSCIGCSACASVCPKYWIMESDGKSSIVNGIKVGDNQILGSVDEPLEIDFEDNMDAAESCPVNCIHLYEIMDEKENKLI